MKSKMEPERFHLRQLACQRRCSAKEGNEPRLGALVASACRPTNIGVFDRTTREHGVDDYDGLSSRAHLSRFMYVAR